MVMCVAAESQPPPPAASSSSSAAEAEGETSEQSGRMHMKEKNDIVMVETNSSSKYHTHCSL